MHHHARGRNGHALQVSGFELDATKAEAAAARAKAEGGLPLVPFVADMGAFVARFVESMVESSDLHARVVPSG